MSPVNNSGDISRILTSTGKTYKIFWIVFQLASYNGGRTRLNKIYRKQPHDELETFCMIC